MKALVEGLRQKVLHAISLAVAFVLIFAGKDFLAAEPGWAAAAIFAFSMPYFAVAYLSKRAYFLYPAKLLGAIAYFVACYGLGAGHEWFPLLSVPLVWALWVVGKAFQKRCVLDERGRELFSLTTFRAMSITAFAFCLLIVVWRDAYGGGSVILRYVPAGTFLGFTALYLLHRLRGASIAHGYVIAPLLLAALLTLGWATNLLSQPAYTVLALVAAGVPMAIGVTYHPNRGENWARPLYATGSLIIFGALAVSIVSQFEWLLISLIASALLSVGYAALARIVDVRSASVWERGWARVWFFTAAGMGWIALVVLTLSSNVSVALAVAVSLAFVALACAYIVMRPAPLIAGKSVHLFVAVALLSVGLAHLSVALSTPVAVAVNIALATLLFIALIIIAKLFTRKKAKSLACATRESTFIVSAFFLMFIMWHVGGGATGGLIAAIVLTVASLVLARISREKRVLFALAVTLPVLVCSVPLLVSVQLAWIIALVACAVLALAFCGIAGDREIMRGGLFLAWITLAIISQSLAGGTGLVSITALSSMAVLLTGAAAVIELKTYQKLFSVLGVIGILATMCVGLLGHPFLLAGVSLVVLGVCCGLGAVMSREGPLGAAAAFLIALGWLTAVFSASLGFPVQMLAGLFLIVLLQGWSLVQSKRWSPMASCLSLAGHASALVMMVALMVHALQDSSFVPIGMAVLYLLFYGVLAALRRKQWDQSGAIIYASVAILLTLAWTSGASYTLQVGRFVVLAVVWVGAGYLFRRVEKHDWENSFYFGAIAVGVFSNLLAIFGPHIDNTWPVYMLNGLLFTILFILLWKDICLYLVTLSLALLAYSWLSNVTTHFTRDALFYLIIGLAFVGPFFLLPYLRVLMARVLKLPFIDILTWRGVVLISLPIVGLGLLCLSVYTARVAGHPRFCISCHYMEDYYESWQHSSHAEVACIECHYEPGIGSEIKGKMGGIVQVVKYVSHAYSKKPHAEVSDTSCMRSSCHPAKTTNTDIVLYEGKIKFNHERHLSHRVRGKQLTCTSCHFQLVEGKHISVSKTTCLTCHFFGKGENAVAAGHCTTCHSLSKEVSFMGQSFDHQAFLGDKAGEDKRCVSCHTSVTQGNADANQVRCKTCHLERDISLPSQETFHEMHVSKHKFHCLTCHNEVKHGSPPVAPQAVSSDDCSKCHGDNRHSIQQRVYAGSALRDVPGEADVMYMAGVSCSGCHGSVRHVEIGDETLTTRVSGTKSCADCHDDESYGDILSEWQNDTRQRLEVVEKRFARIRSELENVNAAKDSGNEARKILSKVKEILDIIRTDGSTGAHNIQYVSSLLDAAEASLRKCETLIALSDQGVEMQRP